MRYMGGKWRQGPAIAKAVADRHTPGAPYFEPFCGGLGSAFRCVPAVHANGGKSFLSDASEAVVNMWLAAINGWEPPTHVTREEYDRVKAARDPKDPLTAFCGFGVSFSARWFASYVDKFEYAKSTRNSIKKKLDVLMACDFQLKHADYREVQPKGNAVIYLDPPYEDRSKVHDFDEFNHKEFWDYARRLAKRGNIVLVTEFMAPPDFKTIFSWGDTISRPMGNEAKNVVDEQIFVHESQFVDVGDLIGDGSAYENPLAQVGIGDLLGETTDEGVEDLV